MAGLFYGGVEVELITGSIVNTPANNKTFLYVDSNYNINLKKSDATTTTVPISSITNSVSTSTVADLTGYLYATIAAASGQSISTSQVAGLTGSLQSQISAITGNSSNVVANTQIGFGSPTGAMSGSNAMLFDPSTKITGKVLFNQSLPHQLTSSLNEVSNVKVNTTLENMSTANQGTYSSMIVQTNVGNLSSAANTNATANGLHVIWDESTMNGSWNGTKSAIKIDMTEISGGSIPNGLNINVSHGSQTSRTVGANGLQVRTSMDRPGAVIATNVIFVAGNQTAGSTNALRMISVNQPGVTSGTINKSIGLSIDKQKASGVNYGVGVAQLSAGDDNYFAGSMQIGGLIENISGNGSGNLVVSGSISAQNSYPVLHTNVLRNSKETASFSSAGTTTIADTTSIFINTNTSTIALYTLNMPANPIDGQRTTFASAGIITGLTMSGNGHTLDGALTTIAANSFGTWCYDLGTTTWYKIG